MINAINTTFDCSPQRFHRVYMDNAINVLFGRVLNYFVSIAKSLNGIDRTVVTKHITNIFNDEELDELSNVQKMHLSSTKPTNAYTLDVILSVGYRVNSSMFYPEGDNCWYWKHKKELCKMPAEIAKLTQPVWDKDFDEGKE